MRIKSDNEAYAITGPAAATNYIARHAIEEHNKRNRHNPLYYEQVFGTTKDPKRDKVVAFVVGDTKKDVKKMHADIREAFELLAAKRKSEEPT